jgi:hypothetical protein
MRKAKKYYIVLGIIQIIIATCFIIAGIAIEANSREQLISASTNILVNLSAPIFFIHGLILIAFHGLGNLIGAFLSFQRFNFASYLGVFFGTTLILWIIFQFVRIGLISFLQPLFIVIGITEAVLGFIIYGKLRKQNQHNRYYESSRLV